MPLLSVPDIIVAWLIYFAFPLLVLGVGAFWSSRTSLTKRALIGGLLTFIGVMELLFFASLMNANIKMSNTVPIGLAVSIIIGLATATAGIISLYKSKLQNALTKL